MAKQGEVRVHHFSHVGDHSCSKGQTSALLLAAKQVLKTQLRIEVPELVVMAQDVPRYGRPRQKSSRLQQKPWLFKEVQLERAVAGHRADAYGIRTDGSPSVVEFRVTNQASEEKQRAYRNANIPAIEVDLRPLLGRLLTMKQLGSEVCDSPTDRVWLHHPESAGIEERLLLELRAMQPILAPAPARGSRHAVHPRLGAADVSQLDP